MININFRRYKEAWISSRAPHLSVVPTKSESKELLKDGGLMVRSISDFDCNYETSFWYLIKSEFSGFDELNSKTRQKIRKSLSLFNFRIVDKEFLIENGYDVYVSAMNNYKVKSIILSKNKFEDELNNYGNEYEFWICEYKDTLKPAGYAINRIIDNVSEYDIMRASSEALIGSQYPLYGFFYSMNEYYLSEKSFKYVQDGSRSISEHSNIQEFVQEKFNFRKAYCNLYIEYVWWLKIFVSSFYHFRNIIPFTDRIPLLMNLKSLLNQEAMRRNKM